MRSICAFPLWRVGLAAAFMMLPLAGRSLAQDNFSQRTSQVTCNWQAVTLGGKPLELDAQHRESFSHRIDLSQGTVDSWPAVIAGQIIAWSPQQGVEDRIDRANAEIEEITNFPGEPPMVLFGSCRGL